MKASTFFCVSKDKIFHCFGGNIWLKHYERFLRDYGRNDIEYFGVSFSCIDNDYGVLFFDSECGNACTQDHLSAYLPLIAEKYGAKEKVIHDL